MQHVHILLTALTHGSFLGICNDMYKKMVQDAAEAGGGTAPAKLRHALKQDEWIVARFWVEDPHLITCGMFVSVTFTVALVLQVFP